MGTILSFDESRWPMDAAAIPLPSPDKTPPVTIMNLVGMSDGRKLEVEQVKS
jgi:hypothetical protein